MYILGISAYYHDSAAVLIKNEEIIAAAQEERFTRKKHDSRFPANSIAFCLSEAEIELKDVEYIAFYDKPFIKFERLLETYLAEAPRGFISFMKAIPIWLKEKLYMKEVVSKEFRELYAKTNDNLSKKELKEFKRVVYEKLRFSEHHQSHAASAFYPSSFEEAAIITVDGVGEWTTTSISYAKHNNIRFLKEIKFPHSLGLLYSAITYYLGFKVNSGEYKVMGLAPYGKPNYAELMKQELIDIKEDGSFHLNMTYFNYTVGLTMTNKRLNKLFGQPIREKETQLTKFHMDIAASLQSITEEIMLKMASYAKSITNSENLCLAGGVALNCVANGKIYKEQIFKNIWVQPASNDSGGALGAAYSLLYQELGYHRSVDSDDKMKGAYLGPSYDDQYTLKYLESINAKYHFYENEDELIEQVANVLIDGKIVGWHSGRMEFGPRALGNRSILGDPRGNKMQNKMNLKIKFRESFRPFAPSVMLEYVDKWFKYTSSSPYMLMTAKVTSEKRINIEESTSDSFLEKLSIPRSHIPATTHVDYSARIQTVSEKSNSRYYRLLKNFFEKTTCPILINTSFNVRGEPIVCSPEDSYKCFIRTGIDVLVIDNTLLYKSEQVIGSQDDSWLEEFELD